MLAKPELVDKDPDYAILIAISVDGTWQKRGYSSKLGVVFVIAIETGEILDYEALSLFCQECNAHKSKNVDTEEYKKWKAAHKQNCSINYEGCNGG